MTFNRVFAFAILLLEGATANAERSQITCQKNDRLGIPVVQFIIENQKVHAAHEILKSELTGSLIQGPRLKIISSSESQIFNFDLGYNDTIDSTLAIDLHGSQPSVRLDRYDRDDATSSSETLVCPPGFK